MFEVLKIKDGIIESHSIVNRKLREGEVVVDDWQGTVGEPLTFYDENYKRYTDVELIEKGLKELPKGQEIIDGELKTIEETEEKELTEEEKTQQKITALKGYLYSTDWVVIKTLELQMKGEKVTHDYSDILAEREKAREEINKLEKEVKNE